MSRLIVVLMGSLWGSAVLSPQDSPKIAVVDIRRCFAEYDRTKTIDKELTDYAEELKKAVDSGGESKETARAKYLDRYSLRQAEVYNEVRAVAGRWAKQGGYGLVLTLVDADVDPKEPDVAAQIGRRGSVLYHSGELDATADVVKALNAEYAKSKKKKY